MSMKINQLKIENVKRVKAVHLEPSANGLTIIGGNNRQGKTSVLDAIAWALGGAKFKPSNPQREGSVVPPSLHIKMNNGLVVERKGKNSDLKVIDPEGNKGGQQLLDTFVEELALDLPKFMQASNKDKAQTLLKIIGVGEELYRLETEEQEKYNRRLTIGQIADQKKKFAAEQPYYPDAPDDLVSVSELISQQQEILTRNGENQKLRDNFGRMSQELERTNDQIKSTERQIQELQERLADQKKAAAELTDKLTIARKTVEQLQDESTAELETSIRTVEETNEKVRANLNKSKAEDDAKDHKDAYDVLTNEIQAIRQQKIDLLKNAKLPLEGLSVEDGELTYQGFKWDNMSGADQLKVATAIVRQLKPDCGFVLLDKLEQMDMDTLKEFGQWLEAEGLQAIATRVSTGEECEVIIEDGYVKGQEFTSDEPDEKPKWKAGSF